MTMMMASVMARLKEQKHLSCINGDEKTGNIPVEKNGGSKTNFTKTSLSRNDNDNGPLGRIYSCITRRATAALQGRENRAFFCRENELFRHHTLIAGSMQLCWLPGDNGGAVRSYWSAFPTKANNTSKKLEAHQCIGFRGTPQPDESHLAHPRKRNDRGARCAKLRLNGLRSQYKVTRNPVRERRFLPGQRDSTNDEVVHVAGRKLPHILAVIQAI